MEESGDIGESPDTFKNIFHVIGLYALLNFSVETYFKVIASIFMFTFCNADIVLIYVPVIYFGLFHKAYFHENLKFLISLFPWEFEYVFLSS